MIPKTRPPVFTRTKTPPLTCPVCGKVEANVSHLCTSCWLQLPLRDRQQIYRMSQQGLDPSQRVAQVVQKLKEARPQLGRILGIDGAAGPDRTVAALQDLARRVDFTNSIAST